jgi:hypothetical protein
MNITTRHIMIYSYMNSIWEFSPREKILSVFVFITDPFSSLITGLACSCSSSACPHITCRSQSTRIRFRTLLEKQAFVLGGNPHLYRVSTRYKCEYLYQGCYAPVPMWFSCQLRLPPFHFLFLFFVLSFLFFLLFSFIFHLSSHLKQTQDSTSHLTTQDSSHLIWITNFTAQDLHAQSS